MNGSNGASASSASARARYCQGVRRDGRPCKKRLLDIDEEALRPGKRLEVKCPTCNHMNRFAGPVAVS